MNNDNSFGITQQSPATVTLPILQQQQTIPIMSSVSISSLPTLPPSTIVRAVFASPEHQQQMQLVQPQHQQFINVFPIQHQLSHHSSTGEVESAPMIAPSASFPIQNLPSVSAASAASASQPKSKGQPKQPRQPKVTKKTPKPQPQQPAQFQQHQQQPQPKATPHPQGNRLTKKQQEKEDYYNRKYQLLRKCIRSLTFKNAALCDEVARLHQRIATVDDERKTLLKRLLHHERLKVRRKQTAESKKAQQQAAAAAAAAASMATQMTVTALNLISSPVPISGVDMEIR